MAVWNTCLIRQNELEVLTYIRGSIPVNSLFAKSQNLSPHAVKTILTRVGRQQNCFYR
jgi:predicted ribonuclease YlaK